MRILFVIVSYRILPIILGFLFSYASLHADSIVIYSTETNRALSYRPSLDPSPYLLRPDVLIFNDRTTQTETEVQILLSTTPIRYFKKTGDPEISEMNPLEKAQVDDEIRLRRILFTRNLSSTSLRAIDSNAMLVRALAETAIDEINIIRRWDMSLKTAVAAASTLAQLKTNIAALPSLPDRTSLELRNSILNKILSGAAD